MSTFIYPFDINSNSIKIYLQVIKNCFRLIEKNNIHIKVDGIVLFLKYNHDLSCYYIIINKKEYYLQSLKSKSLPETYRKIILTFEELLNQKEFLEVLGSLKLNKFSNRTISFIFKDDIVYPTCLFTSTLGINKNLLMLDSLYCYFSNIELIKSTSLNLDIKEKYSDLYKKFLSKLKSLSLTTNNKIEKIENFFELTLDKKSNKISFKKFQMLKDLELEVSNNDVFYYLIYLITIELNLFLNENFNLGNLDLMFFDKESNKIIKIPFRLSKNVQIERENKDLLPPLLPVRI